jgi:hypothetical protein
MDFRAHINYATDLVSQSEPSWTGFGRWIAGCAHAPSALPMHSVLGSAEMRMRLVVVQRLTTCARPARWHRSPQSAFRFLCC